MKNKMFNMSTGFARLISVILGNFVYSRLDVGFQSVFLSFFFGHFYFWYQKIGLKRD